MSEKNNLFKIFKENKKLVYAVNILIILVAVSVLLKMDTSKLTNEPSKSSALISQKDISPADEYVFSLEKRLEEILSRIEGITKIDVMVYTKNTPELQPVYDENSSNESDIETGSDGIKRETKRDTKQSKVILDNDEKVVEKYYKYPEVSGVLIVVNYSGQQDIKTILINSVKTLLNIQVNDIEIVRANG